MRTVSGITIIQTRQDKHMFHIVFTWRKSIFQDEQSDEFADIYHDIYFCVACELLMLVMVYSHFHNHHVHKHTHHVTSVSFWGFNGNRTATVAFKYEY